MGLAVEVMDAAAFPEDAVVVAIPVLAAPGANGSGSDGSSDDRPDDSAKKLPPAFVPGVETTAAALGVEVDPGSDLVSRQGFTGGAGQTLALRTDGERLGLLVGLGRAEGLEPERWRRAAAGLARAAGEGGTAVLLAGITVDAAVELVELGAAVAEGAILAGYRYDRFRSKPRPGGIDRLVLVAGRPQDHEPLAEGARRGAATAAAVAFARDLVNCPPGDLPPRTLAEWVLGHLRESPQVDAEAWDAERLVAGRFGGILGVSQGSVEEPRLLRATYEPVDPWTGPDGTVPHVVLVGKGITFDSGGLSLKTPDGMTTMKTDMSGAAIVSAVVSACAANGVRVRVTAIAPMAENMPGAAALKPGDVITIRNGSTIEVLNTDAEGRLILADALTLATELEPDAIVDVATLTGAATAALGTSIAPVFGNDQALGERLMRASRRSGERLWPMPLPEEYADHIDSDVADMKNIGRPGQAGAIAAALLLERFVGSVPWAHLDIAGTGRSTESSGYLTKGGTAFGVRLLLDLLRTWPQG